MSTTGDVETRASVAIVRTHQRFLLRELHFTQQYATMYGCRLAQLGPRALARLRAATGDDSAAAALPHRRVLELKPGEEAVCVGTVFKQLRAFVGFLDEYQKELVRIDAGADDEGGAGGGDDDGGGAESFLEGVDPEEAALAARRASSAALLATGGAAAMTSDGDALLLEDDSGRVEVTGLTPAQVHRITTGMVVAVVGHLAAKGKLEVRRVVLSGAPTPPPLPIPRTPAAASPVYIGIVCGLGIGHAGQVGGGAPLDMLVDFLAGNLGDDATLRRASRVARLVIGGNLIEATEELLLKRKVKLEPADHVRIADANAAASAARCMAEADRVLARIAETIEVDVMPGDTDASNAYLPQQPLHPVMLREAAKRSTLRLVTNPYEFSAVPRGEATGDDEGATESVDAQPPLLFVSAGQNVDDVCRQTRFADTLDAMATIVESGTACPTAPNTLQCYPFKDVDPFIFQHAPRVFVACNQMAFGTRWDGNVRLVTVPPFSTSGALVLVDVASSTFETSVINFL